MKEKTSVNKEDAPVFHKGKQYIEVPLRMHCSRIRRRWQKLVAFFLTPCYLIAARILRAPGIRIHIKFALLAIRLFLLRRISWRTAYGLIYFPMESTRYFEFHEVLKSLSNTSFHQYLDVSSPNIVPLMLLMENEDAVANMINPDDRDLQRTAHLASALKLTNRCTFANSTIETANHPPKTFDLITCISVLEHIPEDKKALEVMWSLLCPGGRLVITLPCMATPLEQYISRNDYGVLSPGPDGYTFWQRFYDQERLNSVIFNIAGAPVKMIVYGEKKNGLFYRNVSAKHLLGRRYPYWRESYMMAREYRYFKSIAELPGEGVVMLEFVKR
jgi:predicted SAM-dependent methyltransferase